MIKTLFFFFIIISCSSNERPEKIKFEKKLEAKNLSSAKECNQGDSFACSRYLKTFSALNNPEQALAIAAKHCQKNESLYCYLEGYLNYFSGEVEQGLKILKHECRKDNRYACYFLGHRTLSIERKDKINKSNEYFKKSCALGDSSGCYTEYAFNEFLTDKDLDLKKFNRLKEEFKNSKDKRIDFDLDLAQLYKDKKPDVYIENLKEICTTGNVDACYYLELQQKNSDEVSIKYCEKNSSHACGSLCTSQYKEKKSSASYYCEKACLNNNPTACAFLGFLTDMDKYLSDGFFFHEYACIQAVIPSCKVMAYVYEAVGNRNKAINYYSLVCDDGDKASCQKLKEIKGR